MGLSVKSIFKILVGTIVLIVVISMVIEFYNVSMTSFELSKSMRMAANQACVLFAQETYKQRGAGGAMNLEDVKGSEGGFYISGAFYSGSSEASIYGSMYGGGGEFGAFLAQMSGFYNTQEMMNGSSGGKSYRELLVTPLNMGMPYMDRPTLQRMFQWNLAMILSNCNPDSILVDENGLQYVSYKGYRVYCQAAQIDSIDYRVFDISSGAGGFEQYTGIKGSTLQRYIDENANNPFMGGSDDRENQCVAGINYSVPVAYDGLTPLANIVSYISFNRVEGLDGIAGSGSGNAYNLLPERLQDGGFTGSKNDPSHQFLPVPGRLVYSCVE